MQTRMLVRCEAIITQLVFDHSLRIRMKAETAESPSPSRATTAAQTPDNASIAEPEPESEEGASGSTSSEDETTVRASTISGTSTATAKGKEPAKKGEEDAKDKEKEKEKDASAGSGNLIGKINNLVTTDLANLIDGRDFLFIGAHVFVGVGLFEGAYTYCCRFGSIVCAFAGRVVRVLLVGDPGMEVRWHFSLVRVMWGLRCACSAFMGMVAMILLFPVPGYVASLIQGVQKDRMKKVSYPWQR